MIVDSSALLAVLLGEPDAADLFQVMLEARRVLVATPTLVEASMVAARLGVDGSRRLQGLLESVGAESMAFTAAHAARAVEAFAAYGRGSGHAARLNYGDAMAYAVASVQDEPLLFKGDDFIHTDVARVPTVR